MANTSHKRDTNARRLPRPALIAGPIAVLATVSAVTLGMLGTDPQAASSHLAVGASSPESPEPTSSPTNGAKERPAPVSRSAERFERKPTKLELTMAPKAVEKAISNADTELWTTAALDLWSSPAESAKQHGVLDEEKKVLVTGRSLMGRDEIVLDGEARWVTAGYLTDEKPEPEPEEMGTGGTCTNGSSVPSGVAPGIVAVHQAVCANFPEITSYGTFRADSGDHGSGRAVDIMVSGDRGWQVAEFVRAHASEFSVSYIIYSQRIWSVERGGEGWRGMSDRGSTTANHYDHVHVSVY